MKETLIERLVIVLATLAGQFAAAIEEVNDADVAGVLKARHIARLAGYVGDAIIAAKRGDDTPHERAVVVGDLLTILRQLESDERRMLDTRRAAIARMQLTVTSATIAQVLAVTEEKEVAA